MDFTTIASNIEKHSDGIYHARDKAEISYPEEGNDNCLQIEENSFWFKHRNSVIVEAVKNFSPDHILYDVGGGNGFVTKAIQDANLSSVLVEPGPNGCKNGKNRGIEHVICSTLQDAGFQENSLDAAGMFDVVEHIEDDKQFLKDAFHYIKKDGHIYITVPSFNFLWSQHDHYAGHFRRYSLGQICDLLKEVGFNIRYSTYFFGFLPIPIFLFRSLPYRFGIRKEQNKNKVAELKKEHNDRKGLSQNIVQKMLDREVRMIQQKKKMHFGGSCFIVGQKS